MAKIDSPSALHDFPAAWEDDDWDSLLDRISDAKVGVIPVLGPDVAEVSGRPLSRHLSALLAERLKLNPPDEDDECPLDTLLLDYLRHQGTRDKFTEKFCSLCSRLDAPVPPSLQQIAEMEHFSIYVYTGFDSLLARALTAARGVEPESIAYAPGRINDLTATFQEARRRDRPVIYHLLGEPSTSWDLWALTEEDRLEYYHALQSPTRRPDKLFGELMDKHLLLLGGGLPDWLARFFLRTIKGVPLSRNCGVRQVIADPTLYSADNNRLRTFLTRYSPQTQLHPNTVTGVFIQELHSRYLARHPRKRPVALTPATELIEPPTEAPPASVFLSYAREDQAAVKRLYSGLCDAGVPAWFDHERLEFGDAYERKIFRAIDGARLFIPVVSHATQTRERRFFRREWEHAAKLLPSCHPDVPFVLPVFLDETKVAESSLPDSLTKFQAARLPGGEATADFVAVVKRALAGGGARRT